MHRILMIAALAALPITAQAADLQKFHNVYHVSLLGLPIATSSFSGSFDGRNIKIDGNLKSSGVGKLFDDTRGTTRVRGYMAGAAIVPTSYALSYRSGKKNKLTEIGFAKGTVVSTVNRPAPRKRRRGWVPVTDGHLKSVADPLTSTLVKADSLGSVCNRTIRIFDGEMRSDLRLSGGTVRPYAIGRATGKSITCNARFIPVAGYRQGSSGTEYLRTKSRISIAFAELGRTGVYAPVKASIGTKIGTIHITASRFGTAN